MANKTNKSPARKPAQQVVEPVQQSTVSWFNGIEVQSLPQTNGTFNVQNGGNAWPTSITDVRHIIELGMLRFVLERASEIEKELKQMGSK